MACILVIEDEAPIRANLRRFLMMEGHEVVEADNGIDGVAAIRSRRPDVILCDVMMPGLDGFQVLRSLREDPAVAKTPFVFLTASAEKNDERFGMDLGADVYITKPFSLPEIAETLQRLLHGA